jgi:AcrR family transcriptional regulator
MRDALLDAAADAFLRDGYEGASINRILLAAGLSKGAFYYYFDDKADLAAAVLARESASWIEVVGSLPLPATPAEFWQVMAGLNERGLAEVRRSRGRGDLLLRLGIAAARHPEVIERLGPFFVQARDRIAALYRRGQELGVVRADLSVDALMAILQGAKQAVGSALLPADRAPSDAEIREFARVNLDVLRRIVAPAEPQP